MVSIGSIIRFAVGLVLSAEIIRQFIFGVKVSELSLVLSIVFIILSAMYFVFRF